MVKSNTKKKKLEAPYLSVEEFNGYGVAYNDVGEYSAIFRIKNPIRKYSSDIDLYYNYNFFIENLIKTLGAGYCIQKHDIFTNQTYTSPEASGFLQESYFRYFENRPYTVDLTFLTLTQEKKKGRFQYDATSWKSFLTNVDKVKELLSNASFSPLLLTKDEVTVFLHRYFCLNFKDKDFSLSNIYATEDYLRFNDDRMVQCTTLVDVDEVDMPNEITPSFSTDKNGSVFTEDIFSFLDKVPSAEIVIYNQSIYIPNQKQESKRLSTKYNRHSSLPSTANDVAKKDIEAVQKIVETDNKMFVYINYSLITVGKKLDKALNYLESSFGRRGIRLSRSNFNQLELFLCSLPGCAYKSNINYDRFITLNDVAGCLQYKEEETLDEDTPLKVYYTNRAGIPKCIDFTGKEGSKKLTTNSNFFCLGPSGSGKSFHMNSVVRQLYEQDTDIVMIDTGHSYEGLCTYLGGTYVTYREEAPISMNPFAISKEELNIEKINFLKSLIFVIWKGASGSINSIEDEFIQRTLETYYRFYFNPFDTYTNEEVERRKSVLMLEYRTKRKTASPDEEKNVVRRKIKALEASHAGQVSGVESEIARKKIAELKEKYSIEDDEMTSIIKYEISKEEEELRSIRVTELNFNSFFEFALQYIPFLQEESKIYFDIDGFRFLLSKFYKGGAMEKTLNQNMDRSLFNERFIVFEIDAIQDDKTLFPIVTLIIMDLFLQKMRLKKNRKALIIEEAWKAIASPLMAGYILYLYKTVRKFWGIVGVVTQEIEDIISSEIVKSAIINNSEITILLDQTKLKDRFSEIQALLGLTDIECAKIWTINNLDNKQGRGAFKEVYIRRGSYGEVYGVEESPECYMAYTTEKVEKDALAKYRQKYGDIAVAIEHFCQDWRNSGIKKIMDFSKQVMNNL